ncbi:MAG: hypothetical protein UU93_C0002G0008 [Candidatus Amesbacteria bacterium GW2011_GWA2_42_12]|uniref:Uncharacterized protein n=1 Tax=Candidatus Amesbacteria bacterium GW2011_GWA2_42_12 TaxID=1618356 RepID=A0A0G0Y8P2_9BACT|nr:MAG: hypothetical protein UU93_C0002G0008 [Candidatus Amesbacteria bacterium GW2011_GWA2_42_12]
MNFLDRHVAVFGTETDIKTLVILIPFAIAGIYIATHVTLFTDVSIDKLIESCQRVREYYPEVLKFVSYCTEFLH